MSTPSTPRLPFQTRKSKSKKKKNRSSTQQRQQQQRSNTNRRIGVANSDDDDDDDDNHNHHQIASDDDNNENNNNTPRGGLRKIVSSIGLHRIASPTSPLRRRTTTVPSPFSSCSRNTVIPNNDILASPTSVAAAAAATVTNTTTTPTTGLDHHPITITSRKIHKNYKFPQSLFHRKHTKHPSTTAASSSSKVSFRENDDQRRRRKQQELEQRRVQQYATVAWDWIENDCTIDEIVLKIIAYAGGPRILLQRSDEQHAAIHRKWIRLLGGIGPHSDSSWKILSEELYKLDPNSPNNKCNQKPVGGSWKHYYFLNPIVPTDFDTIEDALEYASYTAETLLCKDYVHYYHGKGRSRSNNDNTNRNLSSSSYASRMQYEADDDEEYNHDHSANSCGSFSMFAGTYDGSSWLGVYPWHESLGDIDHDPMEDTGTSSVLEPPWKTSAATFIRNNNNGEDPQYTIRVLLQPGKVYCVEQDSIKIPVSHRRSWVHSLIIETIERPSTLNRTSPSAIIQSKFTTRPTNLNWLSGREPNNNPPSNSLHTNCPLFRLMYGSLSLRNVSLRHECKGNDIWHGNSAIYIPPITSMGASTLQTTLLLDTVAITSQSGRGIVATASDFGNRVVIRIANSLIRSCAATGIYLSTGIIAASMYCSVHDSDIIDNGIGTRQGINRGHSGMYLEGGGSQTIQITNCNISNNETSGICFCSSPSHAPNMQLLIMNEDEFDNKQDNNDNGDTSSLNNDSLLRGIPDTNQQQEHPHHLHNTSMMIRFGMKNSTVITNKLEQLQVVADTTGMNSHALYRLYNRMNNEVALLGTPKPRSSILSSFLQHRHHKKHHSHCQHHC